ncbi:PEP-CTERM sorting domain-containing protein [Luteolibacter soli]|uniref:PEP-CTERM sorting domain-containing protein n=1 Tax=Luteolibacter soli TaxID=3135280 RepID=A0ABU9AT50_9BACT
MKQPSLPQFSRVRSGALAFAVASTLMLQSSRAGNVDTELLILVDAQTYSQSDFNLILDNVAKTFESPSFYAAVTQGGVYGKMASSVMLYNLPTNPVAITWRELTTQQDFFNFANSVRSIAYPNVGWGVSYAAALTSAAASIAASPSNGTTQQITIIDDATGFYQADPAGTKAARNAALASGVDVINAMVFDAAYQEAAVNSFYQANIVSPNGTVSVVSSPQGGPKANSDLNLISGAVQTSVAGPTISAVPEPNTVMALGLAGAAFLMRRRRCRA